MLPAGKASATVSSTCAVPETVATDLNSAGIRIGPKVVEALVAVGLAPQTAVVAVTFTKMNLLA